MISRSVNKNTERNSLHCRERQREEEREWEGGSERRGGIPHNMRQIATTPKHPKQRRWLWRFSMTIPMTMTNVDPPLNIPSPLPIGYISSAHTHQSQFHSHSLSLSSSPSPSLTRSLFRSHSRCDRKLISRQLSRISWLDPAAVSLSSNGRCPCHTCGQEDPH